MAGRVGLLAFVAGVCGVHLLPALPSVAWLALGLVVSLVGAGLMLPRGAPEFGPDHWVPAKRFLSRLLAVAAAVIAGLLYGAVWVEHRLADALDPGNVDKVTRVVLRVAELPRRESESRIFVADVLSSVPEGVPTRIQVRWNSGRYSGPYGPRPGRPSATEFPELFPGQVWRMALVLREPHGGRNPHGFDYEGHVFAQGIRATGTVRGKPVLLGDEPWAGLPVAAQRARHIVREAMLPHIGELRWGGVLLALAIGDQASVASADWQTFNRSGLTHLVSISGSHVTLIAALAGAAVNFLWRRLRRGGRGWAERLPAQLAAAWTALFVAWLYCLLAGWGVPARRTFIMLVVMALSLGLRLQIGPTHVLAMAAFAVVAMDPWSVLASGFWLSFLAVYVLMASTGWWGQGAQLGREPAGAGMWGKLGAATRLQLLVTVALMPPLALLFSEVSLVSPLANAYAIPIIGALVTPLSLLLAGAALLPGLEGVAGGIAWLAHLLLDLCMWPTVWLATLPGAAFIVPASPWWATILALIGVLLALLPRGFPYRSMGWAFMLPALFWTPARPTPGDWELYALDVGQGSALVLRTAGRVLVYDTGVRYSPDADATQRSVLPFLRSLGIRKVDVLVVSHGDLDHVGGVRSLLEAVPVEQAYASFDLEAWLAREARMLGRQPSPLPKALGSCSYGATWRMDAVNFAFLWPLGAGSIDIGAGTRERNRNACVLHIKGAHHSIILPGDIGADEERALVDRGLGSVDIVLAAHHGSRFSSDTVFVSAVRAAHAIAQAGRWNRYGHPAPAIRRRWQTHGSVFWDTGRQGAVIVRSINGVLTVESERERRPRYWSANGS